jgi:hypothetical protein
MDKDVHIRSHATGRYLTLEGGWSALRSDSRRFPTVIAARDWCVQEGLLGVEVVVVRDDLVCMRVPLSERP